ncbi:MAG: hypothetical protein L3J71_02075 [Victivallaceae bacterium]|nr:hypothetical protein [Victivallaceae bacterium]
MNIIIFNGDDFKPEEFKTWRTKKLEIEISKALEKTENNVSFIKFHNLKQFYQELIKIKSDESIVLTLSEYVDDNRERFVSSILEELGIPFVGSGSDAVCNALLKEKAKAFFIKDGIPTPAFFMVASHEDINKCSLEFPVVLKPRSSGCSEGVSIAHNQNQFEKTAKDLLAEFKQPVMVEEYIGGINCREYTVGVLNNDGNRVAIFSEIIIPEKNGVKLLTEKVKNNQETDRITEVNDSLIREKLRSIALKTMQSVDGKDVGRVDIRYDGSNFYVLEINLFPGLGDDSYLRRALNFNNIGFDKLINMIVNSAILRYKMKPTQKMNEISTKTQKEIHKSSETILIDSSMLLTKERTGFTREGGLMTKIKIGLLNKKRGNFKIQEKFIGADNVVDETYKEVAHHKQALIDAGYDVCTICWGESFIKDLQDSNVDLVFNVSSMAEAAILEELEIPFVGSDSASIAVATDKSLAKKIWESEGLQTSPFIVAKSVEDCSVFKNNPPFDYPLFIKPVAGRGSAGIDDNSIIENYDQLLKGVEERLKTIKQPVLIEKFLQGTEITLGIICNGNDTEVLPPLEISFGGEARFLTFDKKEMDNDSFHCPARLNDEAMNRVKEFAKNAYHAIGFKDYGRIDTILTKEGPYLLEGNSFAGLMCTPIEKPHSYIGFMAVAGGMNSAELIDKIVKSALKRYKII